MRHSSHRSRIREAFHALGEGRVVAANACEGRSRLGTAMTVLAPVPRMTPYTSLPSSAVKTSTPMRRAICTGSTGTVPSGQYACSTSCAQASARSRIAGYESVSSDVTPVLPWPCPTLKIDPTADNSGVGRGRGLAESAHAAVGPAGPSAAVRPPQGVAMCRARTSSTVGRTSVREGSFAATGMVTMACVAAARLGRPSASVTQRAGRLREVADGRR